MNPFRILNLSIDMVVDAWTGLYPVKGELGQADCVIGFSFGYRVEGHKVLPGLSNHDIANVAAKRFAKLPKILQFEIADAYAEIAGKDTKVERISKHRQKGKYLDTREVAVQAKAIMDKKGWKTAVLLAHPYHLPRVEAVCEKLGIEWVATEDLKGAVEFDPMSKQKWTRDLDQWRGYEPLAITFYCLKGWL